MSKIAWMGLGAMGARMARRLLDAGHELTIYNRTPERAAPLGEAGARIAATPRRAADGAEIVIGMVTDDDASRELWLDPREGAVLGLGPGAVAVEASTVTPGWIRQLAPRIRERGADLLDAPVAGSRPQAEAGQLIFLVGGDGDALAKVRPALDRLGSAVHHVGPTGLGAVMKLAVNALFGVQVAAMAELLGFLERSGVGGERALEILGDLPVTSAAARGAAGSMVARRFDPMFPIDLVAKDFRYVAKAAGEAGAEVPTAEAAGRVFSRAREAGLGAANISGVAQLFDGPGGSSD
ncbi:MAG: NAD(P)-dependent oxidoreductase [Acidobacteriota bacterium]